MVSAPEAAVSLNPFQPIDPPQLSRVERAVRESFGFSSPPVFFDTIGTTVLDEETSQAFGSEFSGEEFGQYLVSDQVLNTERDNVPASLFFVDPLRGGEDFSVRRLSDSGVFDVTSGSALLDDEEGQRASRLEGVLNADSASVGDTAFDEGGFRDEQFRGGFVAAPEGGTPITVGANDILQISGGEGADWFSGTGASISLFGAGGDDRLEVADVFATELSGGQGNDFISIRQAEQVQVSGGAGDDIIDVGNLVRSASVRIDDFSGNDLINLGDSNFGDTVISFSRDFDASQVNIRRPSATEVLVTLRGEEGSLRITGLDSDNQSSVLLAFGEESRVRNQFAPSVDTVLGPQRPFLREPGVQIGADGNPIIVENGIRLAQPGFDQEGPGERLTTDRGEPLFIANVNLDPDDDDPLIPSTLPQFLFDDNGLPTLLTGRDIEELRLDNPGAVINTLEVFDNGNLRDPEGETITDNRGNMVTFLEDQFGNQVFSESGRPILDRLPLIDTDADPADNPLNSNPSFATPLTPLETDPAGAPLFILTDNNGNIIFDDDTGQPQFTTDAQNFAGNPNIQAFSVDGTLRDGAGDVLTDEFGRGLAVTVDGNTAVATPLADSEFGLQALDEDGNPLFQQASGDIITRFDYDIDDPDLTIELVGQPPRRDEEAATNQLDNFV